MKILMLERKAEKRECGSLLRSEFPNCVTLTKINCINNLGVTQLPIALRTQSVSEGPSVKIGLSLTLWVRNCVTPTIKAIL